MSERTHFGFEQVAVEEKAQRVRGVFDSVATQYDLMNDVMSAGLHRLWKRFAVNATGARAGMRVLDLAGGTGDLARLFADRVGSTGEVVLTDINGAMPRPVATACSTPAAASATRRCRTTAVRELAFRSRQPPRSDCGVTEKEIAPPRCACEAGGVALILEPVWRSRRPATKQPSSPRVGQLVAGDAASYRYLAESIRMHPDQATLAAMMERPGFDRVEVHNLAAGIVALHLGYAY
jgi:demethylmenaquinone methyltransferase/2-methoxy-6-polyprenyl-1,4-benzoquinol methylase